jgi:SAM-dependent methyltransferase
MAAYDRGFYDEQMTGSLRSASIIVPLVLASVPARSVCDIGCGVGTWLCAFLAHGVTDVVGVDGHYVPLDYLKISSQSFRSADLCNALELGRTFDLAVSLEVAEHLPQSSAATFVATLTRLAPVVLFSAAIPAQGGTGHINEQWPDYWVGLFAEHDYVAVDAIRPVVWENPNVEWWYRQNTFVYVKRELLPRYPLLEAAAAPPQLPRRLVHPDQLEVACRRRRNFAEKLSSMVRVFRPRGDRPTFDAPRPTLGPNPF